MWSNSERLVTSDYIYDELLTLFRARGHMDRAQDWLNQVGQGRCDVVRVNDVDIQLATEVFFRFADKEWSFTDCTSRVVMERIGIRRAFALTSISGSRNGGGGAVKPQTGRRGGARDTFPAPNRAIELSHPTAAAGP